MFEAVLEDNHVYVKLKDLIRSTGSQQPMFTFAIGVSNVQHYRPVQFYLQSLKYSQISVTFEKFDHATCLIRLHHFQKVWMGIPFETSIYERKNEQYVDLFEWISSFSSDILTESYLCLDESFEIDMIGDLSNRITQVKSFNRVINLTGQIRAGTFSPQSQYSVEYHFNLYQLDQSPMIGRVGDPQIGYFYDNSIIDSNHMMIGNSVPIIHRLNINKVPWRFIIDRSIPRQYQEAVKKGVLSWNRYFKKNQLGSPIQAVIEGDVHYPTDIDIFDAQAWYIVGIQFADLNGPYSGSTSYKIDSRSGENLFGLISLNLPKIASIPTHAYYMSGQVSVKTPLLSSQTPPRLESYIRRMIAVVSAHEMGHQLGLRHNLLGNLSINRDKTANGSLMNYNDLFSDFNDLENLELDTFDRKYDLKAIKYGYLPLKGEVIGIRHPELIDIANQNPTQFGTDENYLEGVNPDVGIFEDTPQTLQYIKKSLNLYHEYRENLIQLVENNVVTTFEYNNMFIYLYQVKYREMISTCLKYIGGRTYSQNRRSYLEVNQGTIMEAISLLLKLMIEVEYTPSEYSYYIFDAVPNITRQKYNPVQSETLYSMNTQNLFDIYTEMIIKMYQGMTALPNLVRFYQNHQGDLTIADLLFNFTFAIEETNDLFIIQQTKGIFPELGHLLCNKQTWQDQVTTFQSLQSYRQILWINQLQKCYTDPEFLLIQSDIKLLFKEIEKGVRRYILPYIKSRIVQPLWKSKPMKIIAHWELILDQVTR